jgi:CHAD domain-containing protein
VRETLERELKLEVAEATFRIPELPGEPLARRHFESVYYDTTSRSLGRSGITLRRRLENGLNLWQLKLPREGHRAELEVPGGPAGPPAPLRALLAAHVRRGPVTPVARLRTRREGVRVTDNGREIADVVVDSVDVMDARRVDRSFVEIEIELVDGDERELRRLGKELRRAGALRGPGLPKVFRVLGIPPASPPDRAAPPGEHLRYLLGRQLRELLANDPGTRLGTDPEDLHKLRVATRRGRALLRAGAGLLDPSRADPMREELRWLGSALGAVRDLDVLLGHLEQTSAGLPERKQVAPILKELRRERERARKELLKVLSSERYFALLDRLEELVCSSPVADSPSLQEIAGAELGRLRRAAKILRGDPPDEELHALRIKAKRLRYAAELAASAIGKPAARVVEAAKILQDVIGDHQDSVVAEERVRAIASRLGSTDVAFGAGVLVERERRRRAEARGAAPGAWASLDELARKAFG